MSIETKQQEIIDEFAIYDDWMEKYEYIIELGKDTPSIEPSKKTDDRLIEGCQSRVWLDASFSEGKLHFKADSDAIITKGIIGLLIRVMDNETPEEPETEDDKTDLFDVATEKEDYPEGNFDENNEDLIEDDSENDLPDAE